MRAYSARRQRGAVNLVVVLLIVLILVLLGVGGGLAVYLATRDAAPVAAASADPAAAPAPPPGKPLYMPLDPPLIVNFDRNGRIGFVQASIQLMARDPKVLDAAKEHLPVVRNNLLMLFSGKSYQDLVGREAREALRLEALAEVNKVLGDQGVAGSFEDLYFTGFVMQ